jgi:hypothetical protein
MPSLPNRAEDSDREAPMICRIGDQVKMGVQHMVANGFMLLGILPS